MKNSMGVLSERVLVCVATRTEMACCLEQPHLEVCQWPEKVDVSGKVFCITGVGIPLTLSRVGRLIAEVNPDLILNLGIAGAYPESGLDIGDIVIATSEIYGDVGFELPFAPGFEPLTEPIWGGDFYRRSMPLSLAEGFSGKEGSFAKPAAGCTVNTCAGTLETGLLRRRIHSADFETMEGAAVAQAGLEAGIPVCEIRSISNFASIRNMQEANIGKALAALKKHMRLQGIPQS